MTTPEQLAMARRIAAETCEDPAWRPEILAGKHDDWHGVRSALAAIIETTEAAAKWLRAKDEGTLVGWRPEYLAEAMERGEHLKGPKP